MMKIIGKNKYQLAGLGVILVSAMALVQATPRIKDMYANKIELWKVIDLFEKSIPLDKAFVESTLGVTLKEKERFEDVIFYEGTHDARMANGMVKSVDFRRNISHFKGAILIFELSRNHPCIRLDDAKVRYPDLKLLPPNPPPMFTPGQPQIEDSVFLSAFETIRSWGSLSFEFESKDGRLRDKGCLVGVTFNFEKR